MYLRVPWELIADPLESARDPQRTFSDALLFCIWHVNHPSEKDIAEVAGEVKCVLFNYALSCWCIASVVYEWIIEPGLSDNDCGKLKNWNISCPSATLAITNLAWTNLRSKPCIRFERPAASRLNPGMALWRTKTSHFLYWQIYVKRGICQFVTVSFSNDYRRRQC